MTGVAAVGLLALVVTKLVDLLRNALDPAVRWPKAWWNIVAFALGIAGAVIWQLDLMAEMLPAPTRMAHWAGVALTGLAIGGAASGWHELLDLFSSSAKRAKRK